jgi:signal transduction histidine kinase
VGPVENIVTLRLLSRPFRRRRTVRLRMTALYGALFLLSGAALLAIASGVAARRTTMVGRAQSGSTAVAPGSASALAQAQGRIQQLESQLAAARTRPPSLPHELLIGSLIALAIMCALSAILGWIMAGHALRPLRTITATARRISEDNLHERLAFTGPDDELKQLADTIDELLERLEGAFAAQRRFVANASHELRTPLATIRASLDVAVAKPEPVPVQTVALAGRLRAELDRIDELLEGFLALARAQHGALTGSATISLGGLASAALAVRSGVITAMGLTVRSEAGPDTALTTGSLALISRMVDNVVDNAITHNDRGGWISVRADADGCCACVVIENGGAILDPLQVSQLAQPFRRLGADHLPADRVGAGRGASGSGTGNGGSGLGLSIVAAVAAAHGGALELSARPAGGLRVKITMPLAAGAALAGAAR